ncbi:class I SAM-dependent methyltransferase [Dokdonella soli]|uniref:Class I SAM-dependent methyltransferase n=1 Tax=Dokdonella soli TaxID=529810 RepID=A0ABN1IIT7_9GAMM
MLQTETLSRCPICAGASLHRMLTAPDHESHTGDYGIDECADCNAAFTNPRPLESELPKLYEQRSTADFPRMDSTAQRLRDYAIDRYLNGQLGDSPTSAATDFRALDFGCGDGALARGLVRIGRARGCAIEVTAVDFHDVAPPALANIGTTVNYRSNDEWRANPSRYNAIFLRHVLEHHPQPLHLLGELAATLRPGGRLFIEVPNRRSVWARVFGPAYFGYYLPRHLLHFDALSLRDVIERAGMACASLGLAHTPLIGRSLGYLSGRDIGNTGPLGLASYPLQIAVDAIAGSSSTLRAVAIAHG